MRNSVESSTRPIKTNNVWTAAGPFSPSLFSAPQSPSGIVINTRHLDMQILINHPKAPLLQISPTNTFIFTHNLPLPPIHRTHKKKYFTSYYHAPISFLVQLTRKESVYRHVKHEYCMKPPSTGVVRYFPKTIVFSLGNTPTFLGSKRTKKSYQNCDFFAIVINISFALGASWEPK